MFASFFASKKKDLTYLLLAGIVAAGLCLRLINIGAEPYWGDEVLSLDIVLHFDLTEEMVRYVREVEFHPPLYYLLLKPWVAAFGPSEAATRALSLLFGLGTIVAVYALGRSVFSDRRAGLAAALVVAALPMQIEFSQEARPYSAVCFFGVLAAYGLWRYLRERRPAFAALYAASTIVGLYLSYSYALIALATAGWWLIEIAAAEKRGRWKLVESFVLAHGAVFLGFFPWLDALLAKMMLSEHLIFGLPRSSMPYRHVGFFGALFDQTVWMTKQKGVLQVVLLAQLLVKAAFLAGLVAVACRWLAGRPRSGRLLPAAFAAWLAASVAALFMLSPLSLPYAPLYQRHALFLTVPVALAFGAVAAGLDRRKGAALLALLLVSLLPFVADVAGNDAEWDRAHRVREAGEYITEHGGPGDLAIASFSSTRSDLAHYVREDIPVVAMVPLAYYGNDIWDSRATLGLLENESQVRFRATPVGGGAANGGAAIETAASGDQSVTPAGIVRKLDALDRMYAPGRMWLYGFSERDYSVHGWFKERGWRRGFAAIGGIFPLDMYVRP